MARVIGGIGHTLLSLSVLAVLAGCGGGPGVTQNALPSGGSSGSPGSGGSGGNANPGPTAPTPGGGTTNPGTTDPGTTNPGGGTNPTTPPVNEAIGDLATATANSAVLTTTRTDVYNLNTVALGSSGWRPTALLEHDTVNLGGERINTSPRVAFDAAGNGFAVWALRDIFVSRYTASTASWSTPTVLDVGIDIAHQPRIAIDRPTGNAIVTWTESDGVAESIYATRFTAATNAWSTPEVLENSNNPVSGEDENSSVSVAGSQAAVAWRQSDGTTLHVYLSRLENGSWSVPVQVDTGVNQALHPEVAVDLNGNVTVAWRQQDPLTGFRINTRRWDNTTQSFGPVMPMNGAGDRQHRLQFDGAGNAFLVWRNGGVFVRQFNVTTGQWTNQIDISAGIGGTMDAQLSVDAAGNAMVAWIENAGGIPSMYARRYSAASGTWGNYELLENSNTPVNLDLFVTVSMVGNEAVVAWVEQGAHNDLYGIKMTDGVWGPVTLLETRDEMASQVTSAVNAAGNAAVLWQQADGLQPSVYQAMFQTSNFIVPNGATWQSVANALYGVNNVEAGNALQAAMGGGTLSAGAILSGFPSTLTVTTTIPGYYTVLSTDTWAHVAQRVYGVTDVAAITQLQTLLGTTTLTAGQHLVVPSSFQYTTSANFRAPLDWTRVNTTSTTYHPLNNSALTVPLTDWTPQQLLETNPVETFEPRVAFDHAGNGIAVWLQGGDVVMSRFTISNGQWSTATVLDANPNEAFSPRVTIEQTTGNAFVSWAQSDGAAVSMYVSSFNASTNTWSAAQLLETSNFAVTPSTGTSSSSTGEHAAIAWVQSDGTLGHLYVSRLVAGTWTAPVRVDTGTAYGVGDHPEVKIDSNGNAMLAWRQRDPNEGFRIYARRWDNTTQSFGPVVGLNGPGERHPRLGMDAAGNAIVLWRGGGVYSRRYDVTTGQWSPQVQLNVGSGPGTTGEISVDANGDALAAFVDTDSTGPSQYARRYDAATGTWGSAVALENSSEAVNVDMEAAVSLVNGNAVVAWAQQNGQLYAARFSNGVWGDPVNIESRTEAASMPVVAMDGASNATALWIQADGVRRSIYSARSSATPYYVVPAGATWQSLANTLYGIDSVSAATALQTAMSNPTLTTGLHLQPLPTTLTVTPPVPTHYIVQSGDTWQSIALALYGTSRSEAATALWDYLGRPTLTVGQQLLIPAELAYTITE
ncbi:LysM peptidoglycan-binding domain-containing protein [Steroidobacter cummioxidans]|uniref:LysM peptidoglycan-binding domain-containing protein n=1 Tax=Steroidobacter cummioxidans TaxID=1803913 RepID=UPI000E310EFC|nr:LysM peptidoglycan-binding domain-containing protein [Steroidobacter cummioxidans]